MSKYNIARTSLNKWTVEDHKVLLALPKDTVPERIWAEYLQKEENERIVLDIREEIVEGALHIGYERYMERQSAPFVTHCAALAWLKLIDWEFYRHDPGEDPTAYPKCFIPKRLESWVPDEMPDPSPRDSWTRNNLDVVEEVTEEGLRKWPSSSSIDMPVVEQIPKEYWFPGKVQLPGYMEVDSDYDTVTYGETVSSEIGADSEMLQRVTDYTPRDESSITESIKLNTGDSSVKEESVTTTEEALSSQKGAGDTRQPSKGRVKPSKSAFLRYGRAGPSVLPPISPDSRSRISVISDCRLRSLRGRKESNRWSSDFEGRAVR